MPQRRKLSRRSSRRGYTLAELLIVVAMIGVMSALAIVGYRKYLNAAQASEAKAMIQGIRAGEEAYKSEMLVYLSCSTSLTDYYPHDATASKDDSRWSWVRSTDAKYNDPAKGWQLLNVSADGPVRFGYSVVANVAPSPLPAPGPGFKFPPAIPAVPDGIPWYVVQAANRRSASSNIVIFISSSLSGEIYGENDDQ